MKFSQLVLSAFTLLFFQKTGFAQPFTQNQFAVSEQPEIVYGQATDFAGNLVTLTLDLFKPVGDGNLKRPVYIHAHGGSWLEVSSKNQVDTRLACLEMAKKGYVVANIEYRRGFHRLANYTQYAFCNTTVFPGSTDCFYALDSMEILRAVYRGMQDMRGAIRFLKARHLVDSTEIGQFFVGGESAGGFIALQTAFLDCENEKPSACFALADAPPADADLADCNPPILSLARPDLGSFEGSLHLSNGFDSRVRGVGNFFGAAFFDLLTEAVGPIPGLFSFHQKSDVVVDCGLKMPILSVFEQLILPLNLCQPFTTAPRATGSCWLQNFIQNSPLPMPVSQFFIVENGPPNVFASPPGHAYDNIGLRMGQLSQFFSPIIGGQTSLTVGSGCFVGVENVDDLVEEFAVSPNPCSDFLAIRCGKNYPQAVQIGLFSSLGNRLFFKKINFVAGENRLDLADGLPGGVHFLVIEKAGERWVRRVVCVR